jgi:hypothetical protein
MNEKNLLNYPLSGYEMLKLNPDAKLMSYDQLNNVTNIKELFKNTNKLIILYLLQSKTSGHWCCLFLNNTGFNYFDSYGEDIDEQLKYLTKEERNDYNQKKDKLKQLLKNYFVIYNNISLQEKGTMTCGCFVTHRLHHYNENAKNYIDFFRLYVESPDLYVAKYCYNLLK